MPEKTPRERSLENLRPIPINQRSPEERKEICRKGQEASQQVQREKKTLREIMQQLATMQCPKGAANLGDLQQTALDLAKEQGKEITLYQAGALAQYAKMLQGDTRAAEFVRDSAGDKPGEQLQVEGVMSAGDTALLHKYAAIKAAEDPKPGE